MVVTERGGGKMDGKWMSNADDDSDDDDNSNSSDGKRYTGRKRKLSEHDEETAEKRRKNREAAKRCREKKQAMAEDLKKKNGELEQENCELARQRDALKERCLKYQQEIEQHKQQGCVVPHYDPPYDLNTILRSDSSPPRSRSCSPAPSISPAPSCRGNHAHSNHAHSSRTHNKPQAEYMSDAQNHAQSEFNHSHTPVYTSQGVAPASSTLTPSASPSPDPSPTPKVHYLRVKKKDGSVTTLQLSHEDYVKVSSRLQALKVKKQQQQQQQLQQQQLQEQQEQQQQQQQQQMLKLQQQILQQTIPVPVSQEMPFLPQMPEESGQGQGQGQKLDTVDDLISVLQNNVAARDGQYTLVPVNPNDVLPSSAYHAYNIPVKEEPADSGYELRRPSLPFTPSVKVKGEAGGTASQWVSTAETIRGGMDALNAADLDPVATSTSASIQNIVQYLETEDRLTVTVTDPVTSTVLVTTPSSRPLPLPAPRSTPRQVVTSDPTQPRTYIMSSAAMDSLGKVKVAQGSEGSAALQNVKLRQQPTLTQLNSQVRVQGQAPGVSASFTSSSSSSLPTSVAMTTAPMTLNSGDLASIQLSVSGGAGTSENLMTTSTAQILDYLNTHSIETLRM